MPGKRMGSWVFGLLMLLAFLIGPIWAWYSYKNLNERPDGYHADSPWLSGPLSSAHASMKDDSPSCHVEPFAAVPDKPCVGCHTGQHTAMYMAHANAPAPILLPPRPSTRT